MFHWCCEKAEVVAAIISLSTFPHHQLRAIQNDSGAPFATEDGYGQHSRMTKTQGALEQWPVCVCAHLFMFVCVCDGVGVR